MRRRDPLQWASTGQVASRVSTRKGLKHKAYIPLRYTGECAMRRGDSPGEKPPIQVTTTCMSARKSLKHKAYIPLRYTRECAGRQGGLRRWRIMISSLRGSALMNSDVRCYECSVRRIIRLSVPFSGTAVKLRLILPAATAIGIRLRHASRESSGLGGLLSNTWRTCP